MHDLDDVLRALDRFHQRATYDAVAVVTGGHFLSVMRGRPKDPFHSWVVNGRSKRPTGYAEDQMHPALRERRYVIRTGDELARWLRAPS
jgi:hypothetical protein